MTCYLQDALQELSVVISDNEHHVAEGDASPLAAGDASMSSAVSFSVDQGSPGGEC